MSENCCGVTNRGIRWVIENCRNFFHRPFLDLSLLICGILFGVDVMLYVVHCWPASVRRCCCKPALSEVLCVIFSVVHSTSDLQWDWLRHLRTRLWCQPAVYIFAGKKFAVWMNVAMETSDIKLCITSPLTCCWTCWLCPRSLCIRTGKNLGILEKVFRFLGFLKIF